MKWYVYLICFVLIIVGVFCGIRLYKEIKAESYVNGSIDIENKFSQESFNYSATSVVFYHDMYDDTDTYMFEIDLLKLDDFNGLTKTYRVALNDFVLLNADVKAGSVFATFDISFYDTEGNQLHNATMKISVLFLSSKTTLTLTTVGNVNASYLEQYFADNGFRLKITEIL